MQRSPQTRRSFDTTTLKPERQVSHIAQNDVISLKLSQIHFWSYNHAGMLVTTTFHVLKFLCKKPSPIYKKKRLSSARPRS